MNLLVRCLTALLFPVVVGGIVFLAAGRVDLPMVWVCLGELGVFLVAGVVWFPRGLVAERLQPGPGAAKDHHQALTMPWLFAHWIIAGLDVGRFHWSDTIPPEAQIGGLIGYAATLVMMFWTMSVNPFYSSVIRIQTDRGHHPIVAGPYRWVRHPGYLATLAGMACGGLALGSWVGMLPLVPVFALFVRRILNEDRLLKAELEGYAAYMEQVRFRLVPGVW